jgi:hypothetical protein
MKFVESWGKVLNLSKVRQIICLCRWNVAIQAIQHALPSTFGHHDCLCLPSHHRSPHVHSILPTFFCFQWAIVLTRASSSPFVLSLLSFGCLLLRPTAYIHCSTHHSYHHVCHHCRVSFLPMVIPLSPKTSHRASSTTKCISSLR